MNTAGMKFVGTIPATLGFYVVVVLTDDLDYPIEVDKSAVVAWSLEEDSLAPFPITLDGVKLNGAHILQPDGSVVWPCGEKFPSVDVWLKWQQDDYTKKRRGAA